jgi:hypothetical protein
VKNEATEQAPFAIAAGDRSDLIKALPEATGSR